MKEVTITIEKDLELAVKGSYVPGEEEVGLPNHFMIFRCQLIDEDRLDELMEWCSVQGKDLWEVLAEKAKEKYLE